MPPVVTDSKCLILVSSTISIYVGRNDSANSSSMENFKDSYSKLLDFMKNKNSNCKIFVCCSCPRGHTDVEDVNNIIKSLATCHRATFVDEYLAFYNNNRQLHTKSSMNHSNISTGNSLIAGGKVVDMVTIMRSLWPKNDVWSVVWRITLWVPVKRQLLCHACNNYGHKDSVCWNE